MQGNVAEIVGDTSSPFKTKIGKWLNKRYRDILRRYPWPHLYGTQTISAVANQATYALNPDFEEIVYIFDNTNKNMLWEQPENGNQNDTSLVGQPDWFSIGESAVKEQPSSASVLAIVSSSSADTTQTIFIKGVAGGVEVEETVTLTGTTPVNSANSYTEVLKIGKSAVTTGTITITSNSAAKTQAVIAPKQLHVRYRIIHFYYIPNAVMSIIIRYKRGFLPLVNDYDYFEIDFEDEAEIGAEADAWRAKRQFSKANQLESHYEQLVERRIFQQEQNRDNVIEPIPYARNIDSTSFGYDRER